MHTYKACLWKASLELGAGKPRLKPQTAFTHSFWVPFRPCVGVSSNALALVPQRELNSFRSD